MSNSKKTMIIILILLLTVIWFLSLSGALSDLFGKSNSCGGTINNTNPFASKKIKSDKIVYFHTKFFLEPKDEYEEEHEKARGYIFEVKTDKDGKILLSEDYYDPVSCETDEAIFSKLQKIIEEHDLVKMNGVSNYTQGLPPEFSPAFLEAVYDSGEKLDFCFDNNPYDDWSRDIMRLLMDELADCGVIELP